MNDEAQREHSESENPMVNTDAEPVTAARRGLSRGQRVVLVVGLLLVGVSVACPPWHALTSGGVLSRSVGYGWLWEPPYGRSIVVSWDRLAAQIVGILAATAAGLLAVGPLTRSSVGIVRRLQHKPPTPVDTAVPVDTVSEVKEEVSKEIFPGIQIPIEGPILEQPGPIREQGKSQLLTGMGLTFAATAIAWTTSVIVGKDVFLSEKQSFPQRFLLWLPTLAAGAPGAVYSIRGGFQALHGKYYSQGRGFVQWLGLALVFLLWWIFVVLCGFVSGYLIVGSDAFK